MSDLTRDKLIEAMAEGLRTYWAGKCVVQPNKAYLREASAALDAIGALAAVVPREADEEMLMAAQGAPTAFEAYPAMVAAADLSRPAVSEEAPAMVAGDG